MPAILSFSPQLLCGPFCVLADRLTKRFIIRNFFAKTSAADDLLFGGRCSGLGVSLMTQDVRAAMAVARTRGSSYLADELIIHRHDAEFLRKRINDATKLTVVQEAISESHHRLVNRVTDAVKSFESYSHVMVIGGGAALIAGAVRQFCGVCEDRFFLSESPQFDLVNGMFAIG